MSADHKNVLQMILDADFAHDAGLDDSPDRYPLFLRRDSWEHPKTAFLVCGSYPDPEVWSQRKPPYFNGPKHEKVLVYGVVHYALTSRYSLEWLSCPSTYAYSRIARPTWWNPPEDRVTLDIRTAPKGQRWPGEDMRIEMTLRFAEGNEDDEETDPFAAQRIVVPGVTGRA